MSSDINFPSDTGITNVTGASGSTDEMMPQSPSNFTLFPQLPPEIRQLIWKFAAHSPRVLRITSMGAVLFNAESREHLQSAETRFRRTIGLRTHSPAPCILAVSQESRTEGLKYYSLGLQLMRGGKVCTYVNSGFDTLYLTLGRFHSRAAGWKYFCLTIGTCKMQRLVVSRQVFCKAADLHGSFHFLWCLRKNLSELVLLDDECNESAQPHHHTSEEIRRVFDEYKTFDDDDENKMPTLTLMSAKEWETESASQFGIAYK